MGHARRTMELTRAEAARRLGTLAEQIEQGTIVIGEEAFPVPESVRLEIKAGSEELEIELEWEAAEEEETEEEQEDRSEGEREDEGTASDEPAANR